MNIKRFPHSRALGLLVLGFLGGCSTLPQPLSPQEHKTIAGADRIAAGHEVEPIVGKLTLPEAVARALKYNLDFRTRLMEQGLAVGQLDLSRFDMLPKLTAAAGYSWRDSDNVSFSKNVTTGEVLQGGPYASTERAVSTADLGLTWNVLDFGVSYYNAKQNGDRVLIAAERRRKAMHLLTQDVRTLYWRAASAEHLRDDLRETIRLAESALADARRAEAEKLRNPIESLRYQRTVLESLRILESIERELSAARIELAAMINVPPGAPLPISAPSAEEISPPPLTLPLEQMEAIAVANNAELREQFYSARMAVAETKKAMLRLFPGISFNAGTKHTSNSYTINRDWLEAGAQVSWNLFGLLSAPASIALAEDSEKLAGHKRMAVQMAVLSQVHLASHQYENAYRQFALADSIWKVDQTINLHGANREAADAQSRLDQIANSTSAIVSLLRRYQALAQVYAAGSKVQATLGLEPAIGSVSDVSLAEITRAIEDAMKRWNKGEMPDLQADTPAPGAVVSPVAAADVGALEKP